MALTHSPSIVRDGLVLHLDAANVKSYPGSGTTWYDLSKNDNDGTLVNGLLFSDNNFTFDGTNDLIDFGTSYNTDNIALTSDFSIEQVFEPISYQPTQYYGLTNVLLYRGNMATYNYQVQVSNSTTITFTKRGTSESLQYHHFTVPEMTNKVNHIVFTITSNTTLSCYLNGELVGTKSITGSAIDNFTYGVPFAIGHSGAHQSDTEFIGNYYLARIYNKPLSIEEVKQNFEALRGRYGI